MTYWPKPYSIWKHVKTDSTYTVLGVSACSTNGDTEGELDVVYLSHTTGKLRHRILNEFMDGRFILTSPMFDLPEHMGIGVDAEGHGPVMADDPNFDKFACWCGSDSCTLWTK